MTDLTDAKGCEKRQLDDALETLHYKNLYVFTGAYVWSLLFNLLC